MQLKLAAAGNVASLVTNDQTCSACSVKVQGLMLYNTLGGTIANPMMDLSNLGNNAEFTGITTPFVSVTDAKNVTFYSPLFNSLDAGSTNWGVNIAQSGAGLTDAITVINATHGNGNYINDTIRTKQISGAGALALYQFQARGTYTDVLSFARLASAPLSSISGYDPCYIDSVATALKCAINGGGFHAYRPTEVGTCTMVAGTCTFVWPTAFANTPLCNVTWNGTGTLTGFVKAVPSTTNCLVTSSVNTDTGVMQVVGTGNPN